jgi:hypothetical protein
MTLHNSRSAGFMPSRLRQVAKGRTRAGGVEPTCGKARRALAEANLAEQSYGTRLPMLSTHR